MKFPMVLSCWLFTDTPSLSVGLGSALNCPVPPGLKGACHLQLGKVHLQLLLSCVRPRGWKDPRCVPIWYEISHSEKPVPTKKTEESFNFIQIKGESPLGHEPTLFSLSKFQRAQSSFIWNSQPHVAPIGWGTRKVQPSQTAYPILPLEPGILPQSSEVQACAESPTCLFQDSGCLGSVTNLLLEGSRDIKTHFKDIPSPMEVFVMTLACLFPISDIP